MSRPISGALIVMAGLLIADPGLVAQTANPDPRVRLRQGQKRDELDAAAKKTYDLIANPTSAHREGNNPLPTPIGMWTWSPGNGEHALAMYNYLRFGTQLPVRQKELAVLIAARYNNSTTQWNSHGTNARRISVEPKIFDVMVSGGPLDGLAEKDAVVIAMGREMFGDKHVSSETFAKAVKLFGRKGVTDLAGLMAFYEYLYISSNVAFDLESGGNQRPVPWTPAKPAARMVAGAAATLPPDIDPESRARVPHVKRADLDAETQKIWDLVSNPTAKNLPAPLGMWLNSPEMAQVVLPAYQYLRYGNGLGTRTTEVASLTAARETDCQFQWTSHEPQALRGGVEQPVIDAVKYHKLDGLNEKDAWIAKYGRELLRDKRVSADTFSQGLKLYGVKGVTDLTNLMAFYEFLYLSSNATFDIQMPAGQVGLLPPPVL